MMFIVSRCNSYSGDTLPTNNLVLAGQDATLLIHEATLADDQEEMAFNKAHTTVGQAVNIAKQFVVLTYIHDHDPGWRTDADWALFCCCWLLLYG